MMEWEARLGVKRGGLDFLADWQPLPELSGDEKQQLHQIKLHYFYLTYFLEHWATEDIIKLAVLLPLLELAGFIAPQLAVTLAPPLPAAAGPKIRRQLVLQGQLWIVIVAHGPPERAIFDATPQVLEQLLGAAGGEPCYALVLNGSEFFFLKLQPGQPPMYGATPVMSLLNRGNELYGVLQGLKHLRQLLA